MYIRIICPLKELICKLSWWNALFWRRVRTLIPIFDLSFLFLQRKGLALCIFPELAHLISKSPLNPLPNNSAGHNDRPGDSLGAKDQVHRSPRPVWLRGGQEASRWRWVWGGLWAPGPWEAFPMLCPLPGLGEAEGMSRFPSRKSRKMPALYSSEVSVNSVLLLRGLAWEQVWQYLPHRNKVWIAVSPQACVHRSWQIVILASHVCMGQSRLW